MTNSPAVSPAEVEPLRRKFNACWGQIFELRHRLDKLEMRHPDRVLTDVPYLSSEETMRLWDRLTVWFANQATEPNTTPCGMAERLLRSLGAEHLPKSTITVEQPK